MEINKDMKVLGVDDHTNQTLMAAYLKNASFATHLSARQEVLDGFTAVSQNLTTAPPIAMISATNTAKYISQAKGSPLVKDLMIKLIGNAALTKLSSIPRLCDYFDQHKNANMNKLPGSTN
ncbi:MAG: hypothetical protein ACI9E4_000316 [Pseudohongiellaceae bacterium]|jgi:hypothetical protein